MKRTDASRLSLSGTPPARSAADEELTPRVILPIDHPAWRKDSVGLSQRAKMFLAKITPILVRVLTFWDHRITSLDVDGRHVEIDPSGSYRAS